MIDLLKFRFTADDATGPAFASIKSELGAVDGALKAVGDRVTGIGRGMRNVGAGLTAGVTAPLALLGTQSLQLYDAQVKAEAAVAQAIISTGGAANLTADELGAMASKLQGLTTFGDEDILQNVTAPLLTFTNITDQVFERAQASVLDMATLLQTDLKSSATLMGKALNDPIAGLGALSKAGVQFSDDQKEVIKALVETGDIAAAQGMILAELETQFQGQAAAAAATPLGQIKQLTNAIGDVKEQLGAEIAPFLAPLVESVRGAVQWFAELDPEVKRNIVIFGGLAAAVGPVLTVLGLATMGIGSLIGVFGTLSAVMMANPVIAIAAGIAAAAYLIYRNWDAISAWFIDLWSALGTAASDGWEWIKGVFEQYTPGILFAAWDFVVAYYTGIWDLIAAGVRIGWDIIAGLFSGEYTPAQLVTDAWAGLVDWFSGLWPRVKATFVAFWDDTKAAIALWPAQFFAAGVDMIDQLIAGIRSRLPMLKAVQDQIGEGVADSIGGPLGIRPSSDSGPMTPETGAALMDLYTNGHAAGSSLAAGARDALDIRSPSRVFAQIGGDTMAGLDAGLKAGTDEVLGTVAAMGPAMGVAMDHNPFVDKLMAWQQAGDGFAGFFRSMLDDMGKNLMRFALNQAWGGIADNLAALGGGGGGGMFSQILGAAFGSFGGGGGAPAMTRPVARPFAAGGVFSSPVNFSMGGAGLGQMAENGPEAIMPLTRVGGRLGVRAIAPSGGGGSTSIVQHFEINVQGGGDDPDRIVAALRPVMREEAAKFWARSNRERL